jgi:hypothetical protein
MKREAASAMEIEFTSQIFKEGKLYVAYAPELDVSSCGGTPARARKNLLQAVRLFLEEAEQRGTLDDILEEAGYRVNKKKLQGPKLVSLKRVSLPVLAGHAKA